ncbi:hypothetical protein I4U23_003219 [Adineta vaga]|nr:hypothetical protein I4U23_003219 [Adineta vaga]
MDKEQRQFRRVLPDAIANVSDEDEMIEHVVHNQPTFSTQNLSPSIIRYSSTISSI